MGRPSTSFLGSSNLKMSKRPVSARSALTDTFIVVVLSVSYRTAHFVVPGFSYKACYKACLVSTYTIIHCFAFFPISLHLIHIVSIYNGIGVGRMKATGN
ncbi:hypothetical protein DFH05DRAFT_1490507 [Lentinula detonsa]|uniref:Uncharacterized protein n=1 Tax=Lentinula detonsa TaxID=2804962 RepID=A0A9W8P0R6_9AGAR|nr:hypothetical protein DFH05DRAFT_1490507 [Lentinula detonsa]